MRVLRNAAIALILGSLAPLLIWVGAGSALYQSRRRAKSSEKGLPNWACSVDNDCPAGFVCVDGYCMPEQS